MASDLNEPTLSSKTVFSGHLITVRQDEVRLPNGATTEREIVVHPQTIAVLPLLDDGRIVFVRQYRKPAERTLLEVPAGGIDEGESPEQAVRRELQEETGYAIAHLEHLCSFYPTPGYSNEFMHLYKATGLTPGTPTEETDTLEVVRMSAAEARDDVRRGKIIDAKTIAALAFIEGGLPG